MRKFQYPWYYKMPTGYDGNVLHTKLQNDVVRLRKQPLNQLKRLKDTTFYFEAKTPLSTHILIQFICLPDKSYRGGEASRDRFKVRAQCRRGKPRAKAEDEKHSWTPDDIFPTLGLYMTLISHHIGLRASQWSPAHPWAAGTRRRSHGLRGRESHTKDPQPSPR